MEQVEQESVKSAGDHNAIPLCIGPLDEISEDEIEALVSTATAAFKRKLELGAN